MNITLYGATGNAGSRILKELISRGHNVTAIARNASKIPASSQIAVKQDDLSDASKTAEVIKGTDAVVSAYAPPQSDTDQLVAAVNILIEAVKTAGVPRLIVVGGAASLEVAPGVTLLDSGHLPEPWLPIARSHSKALAALRTCDIDWTYFSPAAYFEPGARTGHFRLGKDQLIADDKRDSRISMEDYAIALVDELETPAHRKQRFTIGY